MTTPTYGGYTKPILQCDAEGNVVYRRDSGGNEEWYANGKVVHCRDFRGFESWKEYTESGRVSHSWDSNGNHCWRDYNSRGDEIRCYDNNGFVVYYQYDENGEMVSRILKDAEGWLKQTYVCEYGEGGRLISYDAVNSRVNDSEIALLDCIHSLSPLVDSRC